MSYRGEVAYQQDRSPTRAMRDNYYYGDNSSYGQSNQYNGGRAYAQRVDRDPRDYQQRPPNESYQNDRQQVDNLRRPMDGQYNPPQNMNRYTDRDNVAPPPTHRYPQTFQSSVPPRDQSRNAQPPNWGNEQQRDRDFRNEQTEQRRGDGFHEAESQAASRQNYHSNSQQQYYRNENWADDNQFTNRNQQTEHRAPPKPILQDGDNRYQQNQGNFTNTDNQSQRFQADRNVDRYRSPERPTDSYRYSPTSENVNKQSYTSNARQDVGYRQYGQEDRMPHTTDQYGRDNKFEDYHKPGTRPPPEQPQVLAKTSGSTAMFGIVARVDTSPTRQAPVTSPTRTGAPPAQNYSYDQYQEREALQREHVQHNFPSSHTVEQNPNHPTPPLSPKSRGHVQEKNWRPGDTRTQDQYGSSSNQQWNQSRNDRPYHDQHINERGRLPYNQKHESVHNEFQNQYNDRPQPQQNSRPGHREYDNTESSGYGSESTYYTERSYGDQRYPDNRTQYDSQQTDNGIRSPVESYSRSPPAQFDNFQDRYKNNRTQSPPRVQQYDPNGERQYSGGYRNDYQPNRKPQNNYGPPVTVNNHAQRGYSESQPVASQYGRGDYDRHTGPGTNDQNRNYNAEQKNINPGSGVEETHLKSVRNAKNIFEKQSDPKRPPPAPKPLVAPKPHVGSNVNARPIPPRPRNFSEGGWNRQGSRNEFPDATEPLRSPPYRSQHDGTALRYQPPSQPPHSQSMDHLNEVTRHQEPDNMSQRYPVHAKSMQNLDDRSIYAQEDTFQQPRPPHSYQDDRPTGGYRNSYSASQERPMVLGVKYNQEPSPDQNLRSPPGDWNRQQQDPHPTNSTQMQYPPKQFDDRNSWSREPARHEQQSYPNRSTAPSQQSNYGRPRGQSDENDNFVPDVVARSYDLARQNQPPGPEPQQHTSDYNNRRNEDSGIHHQQIQNFRNDVNSGERWPTPPPPIASEIPRQQSVNFEQAHMVNERPQPLQKNYNDDWRRPGPPQQTGPPIHQPTEKPTPARHSEFTVRFDPKLQEYYDNTPSDSQLPPPPQQPPYDSDSSEVDVDAPTPPPSSTRTKPRFTNDTRGASQYERNKPVPVSSHETNLRRGQLYQEHNGGDGPSQLNESRFLQQDQREEQSQPYQPYSQRNDQLSPNNSRTNLARKPHKPQRNSVHLTSPKPTETRSPEYSKQNSFGFDVRETQPLTHPSSKERQRLSKSGALANRKPPSRAGSSSNLTEGNDEYQIEVTDSELSQKATSIEVHREESMRILRAKKDKESSSDTASSVLERSAKERASKRVVKPPDEELPTKSETKKSESKLVYKLPSAEAAKTIPMPNVTEPAAQASRRPPTYTGIGNTPEKPKTDLLSQFKTARDSALRTAAQKQDKALKSVSALVKFSHGKKEQQKSPPKPKLTAAERNAKVLTKMNVEIKPDEKEEKHSRHSHAHGDNDSKLGSTRSSSTIKADKYDGDDDTNGSRHDRDRRGRGRDRQHDEGRGKSRGRSSSRGRDISPNRSKRHSVSRSPSPDIRHRSHRDYDDRRRDERRRHDDPPYHRRPPSPDRHRYPPGNKYPSRPSHHQYPQPYDRHRVTREPDWVEQYRRSRDGGGQPARRAWVNDPRRVEVTIGGRRRELDMDEFEKEVKRATSYNSDFEQPEPRRQMIPTKLSAKKNSNPKRQTPPNDWMNALKEKNRNAERNRMK